MPKQTERRSQNEQKVLETGLKMSRIEPSSWTGYIAENSWFDDDITPKQFKAELYSSDGHVTIMLNSPGGDVFAASQIYTMLKEYPGQITVKIEGIAASAASVIAMAADEVYMSPVSMMMIHNPATIVFGEVSDLQSGIAMLSEVKESIINAYEEKTGLSRAKISHMMDAESWFKCMESSGAWLRRQSPVHN